MNGERGRRVQEVRGVRGHQPLRAQRLGQLDARLEEIEASMSLLHSKMEIIIAYVVAKEGQDRQE